MILSNYEPKKVLEYFEAITQIPHGSGNEQAISDYLVAFAKERGLEFEQDAVNNVIIRKPGTAGYENSKTVIIQGHMDMVCEKNGDTVHDFEKEPLKIYVDGDDIKAEGTTLGADNGIAVAMGMALLDDNQLEHPPLEIVITTDEEVGMKGALNLDASNLKGEYLINVDSETEGQLLVSCAGGAKIRLEFDIEKETVSGDGEGQEICTIQVKGLKGGHSGEDINKSRGNANKLMGRILSDLLETVDFRLVSLDGGAKDNAIPREAVAEIQYNGDEAEKVKECIENWVAILESEFSVSDPNIMLTCESQGGYSEEVYTKALTHKVVKALELVPNGIQTMSSDIEGLVQSSLNIGVAKELEDKVIFILALRSSKKSLVEDMKKQLNILSDAFGAAFVCTGEYPAWEYKEASELRKTFVDVYEKMYNKSPEIKAIHAGLECGIFASKIPGVDIVSLGPNMADIHTPEERLSISSTERTWQYLCEVLKALK